MNSDWRHEPGTWTAIVIALLLWASAFAGIRAGLADYGPGEVALLRFGTASVALLLYAFITRMRLPGKADLPVIALAGFLGISLYHVTLNYGEVSVASGAAALLISTSPVFTALMSSRFLGERVSMWGWIGIVVSFLGAAIIALGEGGGARLNTDALLILVAAVATSAYFIVSKPALRRYSGLEFTSYAIWAGTIPLLVFMPGLLSQFPDASNSSTLAVLYLGVFPGAIAYVLWSHALSRMPASSLSTFLYFQPVNAALIAWVWLREVPAPLTLLGGLISIAGVVIVNTKGAGVAEWSIEPVSDDDTKTRGEVRALFTEYHEWLGEVVCSKRLAEEIANLPGPYAAPVGRLFIARMGGKPVGCVGVRAHEDGRCEIKRLYVSKAARGTGLGRALIERAITAARELGYSHALVTTLPESMQVAAAMYVRLGFEEVEPFVDHSHVDDRVRMSYLSLQL